MKQRICAIITLFFLLCIFPVVRAAEVEENIADMPVSEEKILIDALLEEEGPSGQEPIKRGEYVLKIAKLTKTLFKSAPTLPFEDVPEDADYAPAVYSVLSQGWISSGVNFEPERPIKPQEAVKIAVCAIGGDAPALRRGGFPIGYLTVASNAKLTQGIDMGKDTLSFDDFYKLAFQMMKAKIWAPDIVDSSETSYQKLDSNLLENLYQIEQSTGIVTETTFNSYDKEHDVDFGGIIEVNGIKFNYPELSEDFLGLNCRVYFSEEQGERTAICLYPYKNEEMTLAREDIISVSGKELTYLDEEDESKEISLKSGYLMVYNGRLCDTDDALLIGKGGSVRFLDNDMDGSYDLVFIEVASYLTAQSFDPEKMVLTDTNDKANNIELKDTEIRKMVYLTDNLPVTFDRLQNQVVAVWQSKDKKLTSIALCDQTVSGVISSVSEDEIIIDGTAYSYSDYLMAYDINKIVPGAVISCALGTDGEMAALLTTGSMWRYAYIIGTEQGSRIKDTVRVKLFTEDGKIVVMNLADKVVPDGGAAVTDENLLASLTPQLIRYKIDSEGKINKIDFSEDISGPEIPVDLPEDNKLVCYYKDVTSQYKSNTFSFVTNVSVALEQTTIFVIPSDLNEEEMFAAGSYDKLLSGRTYTIKGIYNLNEYNGCEIAVVTALEKGALVGKSASYLVEDVTETVNAEGENGRNLYCWSNGKYVTLFLPDSISVNKGSNTDICSGDIIRVELKDGSEITSIVVDVDFSSGEVKENISGGGIGLNTAKEDIGYSAGRLYYGSGNYLNLIPYGTTDKSYQARRSHYISSTNIVCYNPKTKKAYPITLAEIRGSRSYGDEADYVVIRQSEYVSSCVFVYMKEG